MTYTNDPMQDLEERRKRLNQPTQSEPVDYETANQKYTQALQEQRKADAQSYLSTIVPKAVGAVGQATSAVALPFDENRKAVVKALSAIPKTDMAAKTTASTASAAISQAFGKSKEAPGVDWLGRIPFTPEYEAKQQEWQQEQKEREKAVTNINAVSLEQQAQILADSAAAADKKHQTADASYNQAQAAYDRWLARNQSDEYLTAISLGEVSEEQQAAFKAEGQALFDAAQAAYNGKMAAYNEWAKINDSAVYHANMLTLNAILPELDEGTKALMYQFGTSYAGAMNHAAGEIFNLSLIPAPLKQRLADLGVSKEDILPLCETYTRILNGEMTKELEKYAYRVGDSNPFLGGALSIGTNALGGLIGLSEIAAQGFNGSSAYLGGDPNAFGFALTNATNAIREGGTDSVRGKNAGDVGADIYQGGLSAGDNALRAAANIVLPGSGELLAASQSATNTYISATRMGATKNEALCLATVDAAIEAATEHFSLGVLTDQMTSAPAKTAWGLAKNLLINIGVEESEELVSFLGSTFAEAFILQDKGEVSALTREYEAKGLSPEKAQKAALKEIILQGGWETMKQTFWASLIGGGGAQVMARQNQKRNARLSGKDIAKAIVERSLAENVSEAEQASPVHGPGHPLLPHSGNSPRGEVAQSARGVALAKPGLDAQQNATEINTTQQIPIDPAQDPAAYLESIVPKPADPEVTSQPDAEVQKNAASEETANGTYSETTVQTNSTQTPVLRTPTYEELTAKPALKVVAIGVNTDGKSYAELKADVLQKAHQEGWLDTPHTNVDTGLPIFVTEQSFTHAFSNLTKDFGADTILAMGKIPDIIREAVLTHVDPPKNKRKAESRVFTFFAAIEGENGTEPVKLTVKEYAGRNFADWPKRIVDYFRRHGGGTTYNTLYDAKALEVLSVEKVEREFGASASVADRGTRPGAKGTPNSIIKIADLLSLVKGDSKKYIPNSNSGESTSPYAIGAANANFSGRAAYQDLLSDDNVQPARANDVRQEEVPIRDTSGREVSQFAANVINSELISDRDVDTVKDLISDGTFGHERQSMNDVVSMAAEEIKKEGADASWDKLSRAVESGNFTEHDIAKAQLLFAHYTRQSGATAQNRAATLLVDMATMATSAGRQLNMFRLMRMLTPEGQLSVVKQNIARFVDKTNKSRSAKKQIAVDIPQEFETAYLDAAQIALSNEKAGANYVGEVLQGAQSDNLATSASLAIDGYFADNADIRAAEDSNILADNSLAEETGKRVADKLTQKARERGVTIEDALFEDIMRFANDKSSQQASKTEKTSNKNLRTIQDYFRYRSFFQTAWDVARSRVENAMQSMEASDKRLDKLYAFLSAATIENTDPIARTFDYGNAKSTLRRGAKEAAQKAGIRMQNKTGDAQTTKQSLRDVLLENWKHKEEAARQIASVAMESLDLSQEAAEQMAADIMEAFYADLAERSADRVAAMFEKKEARQQVKVSLMQRLSDLYNLGAFSSESYRQAAFDSLFGNDSGIDVPDALMRSYVDAAESQKTAIEHTILEYAAAQMPATFAEKWDAWRHMCMLGNLKTQIRNVAGNALFRPFVETKRVIGAMAESILLEQQDRTKAILGPGKEGRSVLAWAKQDARTASSSERMSATYLNGDKTRSKLDELRTIYKTGVLEMSRKGVKGLMSWEDMLCKRSTYATALAGFLKARGVTSAQLTDGSVDAGLLEEGRTYAVKEAMKATFNDVNAISDFFAEFLRGRGDSNVAKLWNILCEGILPYRRTPGNIVARIYEYSPASGIVTLISDTGKLKTGEVSGAEYIDKLASSATGMLAMVIGGVLSSGLFGIKLVGSEPDEEEKAAGVKPYSLVVGNMCIPIEWAAPAAVPLFVGANIAQNRDDGMFFLTNLAYSGMSALQPMLDMSMLSSLNDLITDVKYAEKGTELYTILASIATNYLRQAVPTLFSHAERAAEGTKTTTYAESDDPVLGKTQEFVGSITQRIPGVDLFQVESLDEWGRPTSKERSALQKIIDEVIFPSSATAVELPALEKELVRLGNTQPENVSPSKPKKTITYTAKDGTVYKDNRLTGEQWTEMTKVQGQTSRQLVEGLVASSVYAALTDEAKAKAIGYAYDYARETARIKVLEDYPGYSEKWMSEATSDPVSAILLKAYEYGQKNAGNGFSADRYAEMVSSGASDKAAKLVETVMSGLTPEKDYAVVRPIQQLEAIMDMSGLTAKDEEAALRSVLDDKLEAKYDILTTGKYDLSNDDFVETYRAYLDNQKAKADAVAAIAQALGCGKRQAEQIYQVYKGKVN